MNSLDKGSHRNAPRFLQIVDFIRQQIHSGALPEHTALPSERTIAEQFNVSRMTARRALIAIETEGLAYISGNKGRFVSPTRLRYDIGRMYSFSVHAQDEAIDLKIKLISSGTVSADAALASALMVEKAEKLFKYTRLFLIKDHPIFIEVEYISARLFPDFLENDLEQSTARLLEKQYNKFIYTGDVVMRMRPLQPDEAELLGLATYQAGIELEQISRDENGVPFCYDCQIWRGELAEFSARAVVRQTPDH